MKRLIKISEHDWDNRDLAIVYIGGEVYEDATHAMCLKRYMEDNNIENYLGNKYRPEMRNFSEVSSLNDGQDVILAHRVDKVNSIYFIYGLRNGEQMSDDEIINDLKNVYPDFEIINDLDHDDNDKHGYDQDEQVNKSVKRMIDYSIGDYKEVIEKNGLKINYDSNMIYNEYICFILNPDEDLIETNCIVNDVYEKGKHFDIKNIEEIINNVKPSCENAYNLLTQHNFVFSEKDLLNYGDYAYSKNFGDGKLVIMFLDKKFYFDFEELSDEYSNKLTSGGMEDYSFHPIENLEEQLKFADELMKTAKIKKLIRKYN